MNRILVVILHRVFRHNVNAVTVYLHKHVETPCEGHSAIEGEYSKAHSSMHATLRVGTHYSSRIDLI